jgi:oligopeptide/dipeptide ABC transporter ATP-binding protein
MSGEILIKTRALKKDFSLSSAFPAVAGKTVSAVNNVALKIYKGETLGLVGESGCGKSTFADMLAGLLKPDDGEVLYRDENIFLFTKARMHEFRRNVQIVFQDPLGSLNPRMNIRAIVEAPLKIYKEGSTAGRCEKVIRTLGLVGMREDCLSRYPHEFSGGQQQRIAIARAIILNPEFVICDESVSAMDVSIRSQIINLMQDMQEKFGLTYLFISHDLSVVHHIARRVAVMYLGEIVELAEKYELYKRPLHPYTSTLLASIPLPDRKTQGRTALISGLPPDISGVPCGCRFSVRCPFVSDVCRVLAPELTEVSHNHFVACHKERKAEIEFTL